MNNQPRIKLSRSQIYERVLEALETLAEGGELNPIGIRTQVSELSQIRMTPLFHECFNMAFQELSKLKLDTNTN